MKAIKALFVVLCVCGLCSRTVIHVYRHFHAPVEIVVGP
jgi:hypothetical protein